jgi:mRNA interferase YafQ
MLGQAFSKQFKKDYGLAERRRKPMTKIVAVMDMLINEVPLPAKHHEHPLHGNYEGYTECHIEPNWLLVYRIEDDIVHFDRTGSHADLF